MMMCKGVHWRGNILNTRGTAQDIKFLLQDTCDDGSVFYMVVALAYPRPVIVTVCRYMDGVWDDLGPMKKRKK